MALINTSLPNLVQGVSQQPATLRFDGQCEEQINALSSVADGLKKRPNTRYLNNLTGSEIADGAFIHFINRDKNEKYVLIINNNVAQVFNILDYDTVTTTGSTTYSDGDYLYVAPGDKPKDVLKALTVGDTTFILNTSVNVDRTATKSDAITASSTTNKALVFIKKGDYSTEYNIKIKARYYTGGTLTPSGAVLSGGTIETGTGFNNTGQLEYTLDSGDASAGNPDNSGTDAASAAGDDAGRFVKASSTLNSGTYEFNASFKTPEQPSGKTTQAVSSGYIAKALRDAIDKALKGEFYIEGAWGSNVSYQLNPTPLTVGEVTVIDSARALAGGGETLADLTNREKRGNIEGSLTRSRGGDFSSVSVDSASTLTTTGTEITSFQQYVFEISSDEAFEFEISAFDSKSGSALGVIYKEVDAISDLPTIAPNDFRVKIRGSAEDSEDDYYVKFETDSGGSGIANGGWTEDVGFGEYTALSFPTLPYKLVNTSPDNFDLSAGSWTTRQVGDDDTNPFPSFFNGATTTGDRKISDIFFFKNRLGFLSEGSVIMSESGEYFNFFRTTVRSLLDSDPIDINVASKRVTTLSSAVSFQENLILFGERGQFVLKGGDLLTPKTVSVTPITNYESDTSTAPLELGSYLYFPFTRGNFTGIREFAVNANTDNYDSVEITSHVPQYIPSNVMDIAGSTTENLICLVSNKTAADTKDMYVYKYYWEGNQKVLSSWSKFTFPFSIRGIDFVDSDLYIVAAKNGKTELLKMPMEEKLIDDNTTFTTYLDMRKEGTIGGGFIALSFTPEAGDEIQVYTREYGSTKAGALIPSTVDGTAVTVSTDYNHTNVWLGIKYQMSYTFSEQMFKQRANKRTSPSGYQRHFLKGGTLFFADTSSFRVEVTPKARQTYTNTFTSNIVGSTTIGTLPIESGSFSFPIMSAAKDTAIKIVNDSALPGNFQSAEFESFIHSRSRRV